MEIKENNKKFIARKRNPPKNINDILTFLYADSNEFKLFDRNILKPEIIDIYLDKNEKLFNDNEIVKDENWLKWADKKEKEWFGKDYYFKKNDEFCKKDDKCNNGPNIKQMEVEF